MSTVLLPEKQRQLAGLPDPAERIKITILGQTFYAGRRTAAHILWTIARLAIDHPGAQLVIMQTCYHTGVKLSAGTHDGDGVLDFRIDGLGWPEGQAWLRAHGWACWWRHTGAWLGVGAWHFHAVSLGCPGPVGIYIPGQVNDYYADRSGLVGHVMDPTPHPHPQLIFDYPAWLIAQEDAMPYLDWPDADRKALVADVVAGVAAVIVDGAKLTLAAAARTAANAPGLVRRLGRELGHNLDAREVVKK